MVKTSTEVSTVMSNCAAQIVLEQRFKPLHLPTLGCQVRMCVCAAHVVHMLLEQHLHLISF